MSERELGGKMVCKRLRYEIQIRDAICRKTFECHLLKIQALSADQLF